MSIGNHWRQLFNYSADIVVCWMPPARNATVLAVAHLEFKHVGFLQLNEDQFVLHDQSLRSSTESTVGTVDSLSDDDYGYNETLHF